jgi:hypothetical protein
MIAAAIGVFIGEWLEPKIEAVVKPDSDLMRKALKAGSAAIGAGLAYYALGKVG